ncbi:MAG: AEC family transporter [Clostridia bacterium]|nr:AEC family transporter [Clostridia bacterium]
MLGSIATEIASLFLLIGASVFCKKKGLITDDMERRVSDFVIYVSIPATLILSINGMDTGDGRAFWTKLPLMVGAAYLFTIVFTLVFSFFLRCGKAEKRTLGFMMIFNNVGNIALPVAGAMFGNEGLLYATVFMLFFNIIVWTLGIAILSRGAVRFSPRMFLSPALLSIVAGFVIYLSPFSLPGFLHLTLSRLSGMLSPMAMLIIGCALASLNPRKILRNRLIWRFVLVKQLVLPMVFFLLARLVVSDWRAVAITTLLVAMPSAVSMVPVVKKYGADSALAAQAVVATTVVALPAIPVLMWLMSL